MALKNNEIYFNIFHSITYYFFPTEMNNQELMFCTSPTLLYFYKRNVL